VVGRVRDERLLAPVLLLLGVGALAAARGAVEPSAAPAPPAAVVRMTETDRYEPGELRVRAGDVVRWDNASRSTHTVTDAPAQAGPRFSLLPDGARPFDSGYLGIGQGWSHRFTVPGVYRYYCVLHQHEGMVGTVVVEPRR
jgi:plastocyanin